MKRIIATALIFVFFIMVVPISASAEYSSALYDTLCEGIRNFETSIDVDRLDPTEDEVVEAMSELIFNEPEFFYLKLEYGYSYYNDFNGMNITSVNVSYTLATEEIAAAAEYVDAQIDAIVATLPSGLDDAEKALYFHDYICLNFEYDLTYSIHDIYTFLKEGTGVCQAYALLYDALLTRVGIESHAVLTYDHMWNQVKINNKWYHVDTTWDDPVSDLFGRADHEWFLQSDSAVSADSRKSGFDAKYTSSDSFFDDLSWHDQATPFGFANGNVYCLDDNVISQMNVYTAAHTAIYTITDKWHSSQGTYVDCLSGFGSYNNMLIFNSDAEIKYLDPATSEVGSAGVPSLPESNYIYRMYVSGNKAVFMYDMSYTRTGTVDSIELVFGSVEPEPHVHDDGKWKTLDDGSKELRCTECGELLDSKPAPEPHVHDDGEWKTLDDGSKELRCTECGELLDSEPAPEQPPVDILLGDVNNDGSVDMFDYLMVKSFYFEVTSPTDDQFVRADMNQDGVIDMFDYLLVKSAYFNS